MHKKNQQALKALIVEDELDICFLLTGILNKKNLNAAFVNNLSEAKSAIEIDKPSLLFLDNQLPDGLGINFIKEIKKHYPCVKIVMMTAHDTSADIKNALTNGADLFISKPFTRDTINSAVDILIN